MAGILAVGLFIDQIFNRVDGAIANARQAGLDLEVQAGYQARRTIERAAVVYQDQMNLTMDRVDATVRNTLQGLHALADNVARQANTFRDVASQFQQTANTLPFANHFPQVTRVQPQYVKWNLALPAITLIFRGNFPHSNNPALTPSLTLAGRTFPPSANTTQELQFHIPSNLIFTPARQNSTRMIYEDGTLTTPWQPSGLLASRVNAAFRFVLSLLPNSPGAITLTYTKDVEKVEKQKHVESGYHLDSHKGEQRQDQKYLGGDGKEHKDIQFTARPTQGWKVVPNTSYIESSYHGQCTPPRIFEEDIYFVTAVASTSFQRAVIDDVAWDKGIIDFSIVFDETRTLTVTRTKTKPLPLNWRGSRAFFPKAKWKNWKITVQGFDGNNREMAGHDTTSYVQLKSQNGGYILEATEPTL